MKIYCIEEDQLRAIADATDTAAKIVHALQGLARFADETQRGEIGDNLALLSDALDAATSRVEDVAGECRRNPLIGSIGGRHA